MIDKLLQRLEMLEHQVKEMREILTQEYPDLTREQQALQYELRHFQDLRGLPHTSADKVDLLKLTYSERDWLQGWIDRWDATM